MANFLIVLGCGRASTGDGPDKSAVPVKHMYVQKNVQKDADFKSYDVNYLFQVKGDPIIDGVDSFKPKDELDDGRSYLYYTFHHAGAFESHEYIDFGADIQTVDYAGDWTLKEGVLRVKLTHYGNADYDDVDAYKAHEAKYKITADGQAIEDRDYQNERPLVFKLKGTMIVATGRLKDYDSGKMKWNKTEIRPTSVTGDYSQWKFDFNRAVESD